MNYMLLVYLVLQLFTHPTETNILTESIQLSIQNYGTEEEPNLSVMPELRKDSPISKHEKRFEYLLMNKAAMHQPENFHFRKEFDAFYPDTAKVRALYWDKFVNDQKLLQYFEEAAVPLSNEKMTRQSFTEEELMEVASKFFYADEVLPDNKVQMHICVAINGVQEAKWNRDYTQLAAFCYEAIFTDFDEDPSTIDQCFEEERTKANQSVKYSEEDKEKYLLTYREYLFNGMKTNSSFKANLLRYYKKNKANLSFIIQ